MRTKCRFGVFWTDPTTGPDGYCKLEEGNAGEYNLESKEDLDTLSRFLDDYGCVKECPFWMSLEPPCPECSGDGFTYPNYGRCQICMGTGIELKGEG